MKAMWNGKVIAESHDTVVVENNHYFPAGSLEKKYFNHSDKTTYCPWKGTAAYYSIAVDGQENHAAAWYYPNPKEAAAAIQGHVAFWKGVVVSD